MTDSIKTHYVVANYGYDGFKLNPLGNRLETLTEALASKSWQAKGGFNAAVFEVRPDGYLRCVSKDAPMFDQIFSVNDFRRGALTASAFGEWLARIELVAAKTRSSKGLTQ